MCQNRRRYDDAVQATTRIQSFKAFVRHDSQFTLNIYNMEGKVTIHHGPYETIPSTASPGLEFLKRFLPTMDSLTPSDNAIRPFFTPNAPILVGSDPPTSARQATPLMEVRGRHTARLHHEVHIAWNIDLSEVDRPSRLNERRHDGGSAHGGGDEKLYAPLPGNIPLKRTVMFEATCETVFRNDPDEFPVKIREFNILDLDGKNVEDFQVVEMRMFLDEQPVRARAFSLQMESAFGESQREVE